MTNHAGLSLTRACRYCLLPDQEHFRQSAICLLTLFINAVGNGVESCLTTATIRPIGTIHHTVPAPGGLMKLGSGRG
jgi:hypothetical protein